MKIVWGVVVGASVLKLSVLGAEGNAASAAGFAYFCGTGTVEIVSSSHQDTAWMDTPDFCRRFRVEQNILPALEMMEKDPSYCFAMECTLHLMEFLEAHPERRDEVVRLMREGRLEFGATYNQPYESYLSGEELVRQTYFGRRWIRKNLPGCDARVAFNPDVPGRALQMQQILAKAGIPYLFTSRYHEGLYRWLSPDGSGVLVYSPGHYGNHMWGVFDQPADKAVGAVRAKLDAQGTYYQARGIPPVYALINSMDFSKPKSFQPLISAWNGQPAAAPAPRPPTMAYGSMVDFFDRINSPSAKFDVRMGERPDVWLYIHGPTHHATTSLRREAARLLPAAEAFTTFACLLDGSFARYPSKALDQAWMDEIYIDHGIGGKNGHITDEVFQRKVLSARDTGRKILDQSLASIAARIRTEPERGTPLTVFNALAWRRSEPVTWPVPESLVGAALRVTDASGRELPAQLSAVGVPDEINVAAATLGAKATASSAFKPEYGPEHAIDGRWAVRDPDPILGGSDKWNSASAGAPQWLAVDFGQSRTIHRVVVRHEGCLGVFQDETRYTTADFQVQGAEAAEGPWTDLVPPVVGNTSALTVHSFEPKAVRFLRLYITKGAQTEASMARIFEVQAFASVEKKASNLVFVAPDVPGLGYKTFYVAKAKGAAAPEPTGKAEAGKDEVKIENGFYRLALASGGIRSLYDKEQRRELLKTDRYLGGEVFTLLSVAADNRGKGTDAGEFGAAPMPVVDGSFDRVSRHRPAWRLCEEGAVRTVCELEQPFGNTRVRQRVVVWHALKRIDCEAELLEFNGEPWREFRAALPLALEAPALTYEVPMGTVQIGRDEVPTTGGFAYGDLTYFEPCSAIRPREVQNFVDASDAKGGLTMSSDVSVFDWRDVATNAPADVVLQPVLLASRRSCNGEGNAYPQTGDHRYRFSITTHAGDWREGWRRSVGANYPFDVVAGAGGAAAARLLPEQSFLDVSAPSASVCTVKKAEDDDGAVVRLVEMEGRDGRATLKSFWPVREAWHTAITEEDGAAVECGNRGLQVPLGHHAIETYRLRMEATASR